MSRTACQVRQIMSKINVCEFKNNELWFNFDRVMGVESIIRFTMLRQMITCISLLVRYIAYSVLIIINFTRENFTCHK